MVVDAVRTYLDAASGLTELSRKEAVAAAKILLRANGQVSPVTEGDDLPRVGQSIQALAGELIETSRANQEAIADLVRGEVGRQLETMDVVPRGEYERLARRVAELERRLATRHTVERVLFSPVSPADVGGDGTSEVVRESMGETREKEEAPEPSETEASGKGAPEAKKGPAMGKTKNTRGKSSGKRTAKPAPKSKGATKK